MARSALEDFGDISLATKDVDVLSADYIDWGAPDGRWRGGAFHFTGVGDDRCIVFTAGADFVSTDGFIPFVVDGTTTSPTDKILTGPQVDTILGAAPKKGIAWVLPFPRVHRRYMKAGATPKSTGTFTAKTLHADVEHGAHLGIGVL